MVSKLCCLGPLLKQQGKYYPRKNEERVIEQLERSTWQDCQVPDEAEYPYDWLKSASTTKHRNGRDRRRRFLSRIRSVHAVTDAEIAEDFTFDSIVANEDLSRKESDVIKSVVNPEVPEDKSDVALEIVKSQTVGADGVGTEDRSEVGQNANVSSVLTNAVVTNEQAPSTSLPKEVERQQEKESKSGKEAPSSSQKQGVDVNQATNSTEKFLENDTTVSSVPSASSPCLASASAKSPFPNTHKDISCDHNASSCVHQAHQQSDQGAEDGENAEEQTPTSGILVTQDNVMDHARLEEDRQEQRMRDWIQVHRPTVPRGHSLMQQSGRSSQLENQGQRETNQSSRSGNDHVIHHLIAHRPHPPYPHFPFGLPQQLRQRSHPEHRVRQLSDIEQIQRTLHQYHMQRRSRPDETEQGDRRHERQEQPHEQQNLQRPYLAGEFGTVRNDIDRTRENIVRELRQQAHRTDHREGYVSRVMAIVRQRHSLPEQNADNPPVSQSGHPPPPELERRVRPPNIERVPRLNPHPPRRRRRCRKHFNGAVYQPRKE